MMPTALRRRRSGKVRPPEDGCWPPKKSTSTSPEKLPRSTSGSVTSRPSRVWRMVPPTLLAGVSESTNCGTSLLLTRAFVKKPFTSTRPVTSTVRFATGAGAGGEGGVCAASGRATAASERSNVARISGSWRFRYDYSKLQRFERNREQSMRWSALLVSVGCITAVQLGIAQERVTGRVTLLEKGGKSSPDLGAAVVYLEGGTAGGAARPVTVDIAINDKEFVPRVVVVPVGSTVRFQNHDPFDHNVFSGSRPNPFDLGQYGRGEAKTWTLTSPGLVRVFCNIHPRMVAFVQVMAGRHFTQAAADGSFEIVRRAARHVGAARLARAEPGGLPRGDCNDRRRVGDRAAARRARVPLDAPQEQVRQRLPDECRTRALLGPRGSASGPRSSSPPRCRSRACWA